MIHGGWEARNTIKTLGLATLTASMAIAFAGTSGARAEPTALCDVDPGSGSRGACPAGHLITHVHETSVGKARLLTKAFSVGCSALFLGDVEAPGSSSATLLIQGTYTYSGCTGGCVVTEETRPTEIEVLKLGREAVDVIGYDLLHVNCSGFSNCTYKRPGLRGKGLDPSSSTQPNGEFILRDQFIAKESGVFCLDAARLDFVTTPLRPTYITN